MKNILGYLTGIINTSVFTYLNFKWGLYGEMIINLYYSIISFYAWLHWKKKQSEYSDFIITTIQKKEMIPFFIFWLISGLFLIIVYFIKNNFLKPITTGIFLNLEILDLLDILCTSIFVLAMYLMAKIKLEHWALWMIGNGFSICLYLTKGLLFSAFQYFIFLILAVIAHFDWIKKIKLQHKNSKK